METPVVRLVVAEYRSQIFFSGKLRRPILGFPIGFHLAVCAASATENNDGEFADDRRFRMVFRFYVCLLLRK